MRKRIWISWETQRRSLVLSKKLGCKLYIYDKFGLLRYPYAFVKTLITLFSIKPNLLFVQNPSMVLASVACIYGLFTKTVVIVDRHSTLRLLKPNSDSIKAWIFRKLHYFTLKNADLTIVTNEYVAGLVEDAKGTPFILPDALPQLKNKKPIKLKGEKNILLISSFGLDEPIENVIKATENLVQENICIYITGNYKRLNADLPKRTTPNIIFTGFIPDQEFIDLLFSVDVAMALTTSDHCMLCGCYEALAANKPLITSNKKVLKEYFKNAMFVDNSCVSITEAIQKITKNLDYYNEQNEKMIIQIRDQWEVRFKKLNSLLAQYSN